MLSFCFKIYSDTLHLTLYSSYSIRTTDTQAIKEVPFKLHTTLINIGHNMESLAVKCSNFNIWVSWCLKRSIFWWHHTRLHSMPQPLSCC